MGKPGYLIVFLHRALLWNSYINLQWEDVTEQEFSITFPRYNKKKDITEFEKLLKGYYKWQGRESKYDGYSKARLVMIAALRKSKYLVLVKEVNKTLHFRFVTPVQDNLRKLKEKGLAPEWIASMDFDPALEAVADSPSVMIPSNLPSVASSGYYSCEDGEIPSVSELATEEENGDFILNPEDNGDLIVNPEDFEILINLCLKELNLSEETSMKYTDTVSDAMDVDVPPSECCYSQVATPDLAFPLIPSGHVSPDQSSDACERKGGIFQKDSHSLSLTDVSEDLSLDDYTVSDVMDVDVPPSVCCYSQVATPDLAFPLIPSGHVSPDQSSDACEKKEDIFQRDSHSLSLKDVYEELPLDDYSYLEIPVLRFHSDSSIMSD